MTPRRRIAALAGALAAALVGALAAALAGAAAAERVDPGAAGAAASERVDPGAKIPAGDAASEYWDLVALLDDGTTVTARFAITNEGPGTHNALAFGHVLRPGAAPVQFQNGRRRDHWRLSPDRRRIEIGSSVLALPDGARRFEVDNDKRGVKLFLDWHEDAQTRTAPIGPPEYRIDVLQLASRVKASIRVAEMREPIVAEGSLTLTHTRVPQHEGEILLHRIDVASRAPAPAAYLLVLLSPGGERSSWLSVSGAGAVPIERSGFDVRREGALPGASAAHPRPARMALKGNGVLGSVSLGDPLIEVDPLAALPGFLRMVYSLRGRPHRTWTPASFDLSLAPGAALPKIRVTGDAIAALSFLDTLPPTHQVP